jgi:hypothetical protein
MSYLSFGNGLPVEVAAQIFLGYNPNVNLEWELKLGRI